MENTARSKPAATRPQSFVVRIWLESQDDGQRSLRIQAQHVLTGETRYFLAWSTLTGYLAGKLERPDPMPGA